MKLTKFIVVSMLIALSGCASKMPSSKNVENFDTSIAIAAAHRISSLNKGRFYAYFVYPGGSEATGVAMLREVLAASAKDQMDVAVFGQDYVLNKSVLKEALASFQNNSLRGVAVLYVGDKSDADDLMISAKKTGAEIRSVKYENSGRNPVGKNYTPDPYGVIDRNSQRGAYMVMVINGRALVVGEIK